MSWSIWLAHHPPDEGPRCVHLAGHAVCRRCLTAWPLALGVITTGLALHLPGAGLPELAMLWVLPMGEYVAVHVGWVRYSPRRTWVFGPLLGLALGRTLHRYLLDPTEPATWAVLSAVALLGGLSAAAYHLRVKNPESV